MSGVSFSSGDYIAIAIGCISAVKWLVSAVFQKTDTDEEKLTTLRLDFEKEKATRTEKEAANIATLARIERSINNVQAQIRMLSTGSANKRLRITDEEN